MKPRCVVSEIYNSSKHKHAKDVFVGSRCTCAYFARGDELQKLVTSC